MKRVLSNSVKKIIKVIVNFIGETKSGRYFETLIIANAMSRYTEISHDQANIKFCTPNPLCKWRAETFSNKEPETLEWIDKIPLNSIFWDIGANVGLYSVYAALSRKCKVWAFEPSVFNLELLARNIYLNNLYGDVCIVPLPLSSAVGASLMKMTTTEWGGALSVFGENFGWNGKKINDVFAYQTLGICLDDASKAMKIPKPEYIKMDVDGLEHFILRGGKEVLSNVKQVLIEVNDEFEEQAAECSELLKRAGLTLHEKRHASEMDTQEVGSKCYNQIWIRN